MTSANVLNVLPVSNLTDRKTSNASDMSTLQSNSSFANYLNKSDKNNSNTKIASNTSNDEFQQYRYKENNIASTEKTPVQTKYEDSETDIESAKHEMLAEISQELDVPEEDVEKVLEELGIIVFELFLPQNLASLVEKINPQKDTTNLILDSEFKELLSAVTDIGKELMNKIEVNQSQFDELISRMEIVDKGENEVNQEILLSGLLDEDKTEVVDDTIIQNNDKFLETVVEENSIEDNPTEIEVKNSSKNDFSDSSKENMENSGEDSEEKIESEKFNRKDNVKGAISSENNNGVTSTTPKEFLENNYKPSSSYLAHSDIDTEDIISQIVKKVSVDISSEETTMQMQLNPENLGKVFINISSKNGEINAHIAALNETVREALEAQMVNLRENLNQAGVKVDAIEVTVASHEFERNLEQNNSKEEQEGERQETMSSKRRNNINLSSLDELSGVMGEEEALVAQIMRDNGNTMDVMA